MFLLLLRRLPPPPPTSVCIQRNVLSHLMKLQVNSQHTPVFFFSNVALFISDIMKTAFSGNCEISCNVFSSPGYISFARLQLPVFGKIVIFISIIYEFKRKFVRNDFTPLYNFLHFLRTGNFSHFIITKNIAFN